MLFFIVLLSTLSQVSAAQYLIVNTTILDNAIEKGAVCLDGSAPAYRFDRGTGYGVNSWLVHIEGGGWCSTVSECIKRTTTSHGSSKLMNASGYFQGVLSNKPDENPDFFNWNRVKVMYCDGSSFTGDIDEVDPVTKLHFRGARIFNAIIGDLLNKGMINAENAVLSGTSAGGLAAILNCDKFRNFLPVGVKVKCISDAGFFVNVNTISGKPHIQEFYKAVVTLHGSAKNLLPSCTSSYLEPSLCFFPQYAARHIRTPLFIINSAYDSWQVNNSLIPEEADPYKVWDYCKRDINKCSPSQIQTLQDFRFAFLNALTNDIRPTSPKGYFITSCHSHHGIEKQSYWFNDNSPILANKEIESKRKMSNKQGMVLLQICIFLLVLFPNALVNCKAITREEKEKICQQECVEDYLNLEEMDLDAAKVKGYVEKCKRGERLSPCGLDLTRRFPPIWKRDVHRYYRKGLRSQNLIMAPNAY